jgi:hypothetical protein
MLNLTNLAAACTVVWSICTALTKAEQFHGTGVSVVAGTAGGVLGIAVCVGYYSLRGDLAHSTMESERKGGKPRKYLGLAYFGLLFGTPIIASILAYFLVGYLLAAIYS